MRASSRKLLVILAVLLALGYAIYRSSGMIHGANFSGTKLLHAVRDANPYLLLISLMAIYVCYALRSLRWQLFQRNLGDSHFWTIYKMTLAGFCAVFLLGRMGEPVRPVLLARKENLPLADISGIYALERIFDLTSAAVIAAIAFLLIKSHAIAARTTGTLLFVGVVGAIGILVYLRLHGTSLLERRLQGWLNAHGWRPRVAKILVGFVRGAQTIRGWSELALAVVYSTAHWFLVLLVFLWVSRSFGGKLGTISMADAMLLMAFTLVGSALQLPLAGGGSQLASIFVYTKVFGAPEEAATAAAIVLWLITFAACSLAGVPILIREGFSLGQLKELAEQEKKVLEKEVAAGSGIATRPGEKPE